MESDPVVPSPMAKRNKSLKNLRPIRTKHSLLPLKTPTNSHPNQSFIMHGKPQFYIKDEHKQAWEKFIKAMDVLDSIEHNMTTFFYGKASEYRNLRDKIAKFFSDKIHGLEQENNRLRGQIVEIKQKMKIEENKLTGKKQAFVNSFDATDLREEIEKIQLTNCETEASPYLDQKLQQIDYEISMLMHQMQKTKVLENHKEIVVAELCDNLIKGVAGKTQVEVEPLKTGKVFLKFDLHKPYDVYFVNLQTLAYSKIHVNNLRMPPDSAGIAIGERYFICGGRSDSALIQYNSTFELDAALGRWVKLSDMLCEKRNHSLVAVNQKHFYSICGFNQRSGYLSACEKYSLENDLWTPMPSTKERRQDPTVCPVNGRLIYIFGGGRYEDEEWTCLVSIEVFDTTKENEWKLVRFKEDVGWSPSMYAGAAQVSETQILLFGGYNGEHTNQCFLFDFANRNIQLLSSKLPRPASFISRNSIPCIKNSLLYTISATSFDIFVCSLQDLRWRIISKTARK